MWQVIADYHTHTKYSNGRGSIMDNAREAQRQGLEILGIADHGPANWGHFRVNRLELFERIIEETRKVEEEISGLKILAGTEANIISYQGDLDIPPALQQKLDQVLAGFHTTIIPQTWHEGFRFITEKTMAYLSPRLQRKARENNTKAIVGAVYNNKIDIVTHPGLKISIDTPELARACVKNDTALEINAKHGVKSVDFIRVAAREGVKFAIGSDAHAPDKVGRLETGITAARMAGLTPEQIINIRDN